MEELEVNVQDRILQPVSEVFAAIIDPAKMSGFHFAGHWTNEAGRGD